MNDLDLPQLRGALVGTRFAANIHHYVVIDSTSNALLAAAAEGAPEGTVYFADEQTAGRGRSNHAWHSAGVDAGLAAGLYVSVLVRPSLALADALLLSLATGMAAAEAVYQASGLTLDIRWPNDLLLGPEAGGKKVGGILVETAVEPGSAALRHAVIGIGVNLNQSMFPEELAAVASSLRQATGQAQARQPLLVALLRALDRELSLLEERSVAGPEELMARFTAASSWVRGKRVSIAEQGGYTGTTCGLDGRGFLLVDCDDGARRTVMSGGVRALESQAM